MKIFVSAQLDDRTSVREAQQLLISRGHSLTHDWSESESEVIPPGFAPNADKAGRVAKEDIDGVLNADAFVILTSNPKSGKGMYVELGAALLKAELGLLDHILVVGAMNHETVFYFHPKVKQFAGIEECVDYLDSVEHRSTSIGS